MGWRGLEWKVWGRHRDSDVGTLRHLTYDADRSIAGALGILVHDECNNMTLEWRITT